MVEPWREDPVRRTEAEIKAEDVQDELEEEGEGQLGIAVDEAEGEDDRSERSCMLSDSEMGSNSSRSHRDSSSHMDGVEYTD